MTGDGLARRLRRQLDAELTGVPGAEATERARRDLQARLAAAHPRPARPDRRGGRTGTSAAAVLLTAAAVAGVAVLPALVSGHPAASRGPIAGSPRVATVTPDATRTLAPSPPPPSPAPRPTAPATPPLVVAPPSPPRVAPSRLRLTLRLPAAQAAARRPVVAVVAWTDGAATPAPSALAPRVAGALVRVVWGDGTATSVTLPCPARSGVGAELPPHTYRAPGGYTVRITASSVCGPVVPLTRTVAVAR